MDVTHHAIQRIFKIKSELQEVYWNLVIQNFAKSLIGIFVPIYLITLGFSLQQSITFGLFYFLSLALLSPLAGKLSARLGYKHQILYHLPMAVVFYGILITMQFISIPLFVLYITAIIGGTKSALYWIPLNSEFAKSTKKVHESEEIAEAVAFPKIVSIAAPTIAAVVITALGFSILFAVVIFLLLFSVIPLFATRDTKPHFTFSQEKRLLFRNRTISIRMTMRGVLFFMEGFLWPLYIYMTLGNLVDVGIATSIAGIGIAFFTIIIGKMSDRGNRRSIRKIGSVAYAAVWVSRLFAASPLEFYLLSFLGGMFNVINEVSVFSAFCDVARGKRVLGWVVNRELWIGVGRVGAILIILAAVGGEFHAGFIIAALASLVFLVI